MSYAVRSLTMAIFLSLVLPASVAVAQDNGLDGKLVKYVQDAKKSGRKQPQAQQRAIKAGWPAAAVSQAVAYVYGITSPPAPNSSPETSLNAAVDRTQAAPTIVAESHRKKQSGRPAFSPAEPLSQNAIHPPPGASSGTAQGLRVPYEYQIGAGDVLQIAVWKEPEATASVVVRPDGMISTPLLKELQVAGLTPTQAEKLITEKLIKVIQEPDVTVVVTGINSKNIYAIGAVKKEGTIPYTYSMTIMQAIAEAGGLTDYAKRSKIYVLRNENGEESKIAFNYDEILKGNHTEMNILMLPGDTLVVPH
jgi:polysaccharide export outer membrane protein